MQIAKSSIEQVAVSAVVQACAKVPRAEPAINVNEKGPSVDGCIRVYEDEEHKKSQLQGVINVQVKGTTITDGLSDNFYKYEVELADLRNFERSYGGAIYFVVHLNDDLTTQRIFYHQFLPYDVEQITRALSDQDQEQKTLIFLPLPDDIGTLERIFDEFLSDKKRQALTVFMDGASTSEELEQRGVDISGYSISKTLYNDEVLSDPNVFKNGAYVYADDARTGARYAIDHLDYIAKIKKSQKMAVRSGSIELVTMVEYDEQEQRITCANGFDIRFDDQNAKVNFKTVGGFKERLASCQLLKALIQTGELFFNDQRVLLLKANEPEYLEDLDEQINLLTRYASVEDAIHSKLDWDPDELSDSEFSSLELFAASILDGKPFSSKKELPILLNLNLGNSRVKMVCKSCGEGKYELSDLLCGEYSYSPINPSDEAESNGPIFMPSMLALSKDDFKTVANLDSKLFAESLERFPVTEKGQSFATLKLLDMLRALDDGAICQQDLQSICEVFSDALFAINESAGAMINCLQVRKRARKLDASEKEQLMQEIVSTENLQNKAAAYLLLDDKEGAEFYIDQLSQEDKEEFESWPICKFRS